MKKVIEHLEMQLSVKTLNYNTWVGAYGVDPVAKESFKHLEQEIKDYAQAIKILTKHIEK